MGARRKAGRVDRLCFGLLWTLLLLINAQPCDHAVSSCPPSSTPPVEPYVRAGLAQYMYSPRESYAKVVNPEHKPKKGTRLDDTAYNDKPASNYLPPDRKNVDVNRDYPLHQSESYHYGKSYPSPGHKKSDMIEKTCLSSFPGNRGLSSLSRNTSRARQDDFGLTQHQQCEPGGIGINNDDSGSHIQFLRVSVAEQEAGSITQSITPTEFSALFYDALMSVNLNQSAFGEEGDSSSSSPVMSFTTATQSTLNKTLTVEDHCACPTNSTLSTSSCRREWRTLFLLGVRHLHSMRRASYQANSCAGRRSQRQRIRQWTVDAMPNRKGQAKRNTLFLQYYKMDLNPGPGSHPTNRQIIDLLLMSDIQSSGRKVGRSGILLRDALVLVALVAHLLQDQHCQNMAQRQKNLLRHLLRRLASCTWTESVSSAMKVLDSVLRNSISSNGRYPSPNTGQPMSRGKASTENGYQKTPVSSLSNSNGPSVVGLFVRHTTSVFVAPATSFLPSISSRDTHELDHLGYRLATLGLLPSSCPLSRVRVADAGFHYNPKENPNAVVCHKCGAALSWEPDSLNNSSPRLSPLAFHQATSPRCSFLTSLLDKFTLQPSVPAAQKSSGNIAVQSSVPSQLPTPSGAAALSAMSGNAVAASDGVDGSDLSEDCDARPGISSTTQRSPTHTPPGSGYKLALPGSKSDQFSQPSPSPSIYLPSNFPTHSSLPVPYSREVRPQLDLGQAVYPQFSTVSSRLVTFKDWPLEQTFPHRLMANLGFYYAGYSDCIRCFYCGVGLKSWEPSDSVLKEHVRYRPQCAFLLATSGPSHVQAMMDSLNISQTPSVPTPTPASSNTTTTTNTSCGNSSQRSSEGSNSDSSSSEDGNSPGTPVDGMSAEEGRQLVRQQLVDMGFSQDVIARAESSLYSAGTRVTLDEMLEFICN